MIFLSAIKVRGCAFSSSISLPHASCDQLSQLAQLFILGNKNVFAPEFAVIVIKVCSSSVERPATTLVQTETSQYCGVSPDCSQLKHKQ